MPVDERPTWSKAQLRLIEATLDSLMEEGMEGCSVRKICERACVSTGLINYHFDSVNKLIAAAYSHLAFSYLNTAVQACEKIADNPRQRLSTFLDEIFVDEIMQRRVLRAWIVFWGLIDSSPPIQAAQRVSNGAFTDYLEDLFKQLSRQHQLSLSPRTAAIGLTAMIDGLWLGRCLQDDSYPRVRCLDLCEHWIDSL